MVETLYGVQHGKSIGAKDMSAADFGAAPGKELIKELLLLPPNTSVGIEHTPELEKTFEVDGIPNTTSGSLYWTEIRKVCEQQHLNTVYLEDFLTYKRFTQKIIEARALDEDLLKRNVKFRNSHPNEGTDKFEEDETIKKLLRKIYKTQIEGEYIFVIEREQKMLDKIAEYQPQVVILGKGHTDYLALKPEKLTSKGVSLGKYKTEERKFIPWHEESDESPSNISRLIQNPLPDKSYLVYRELLERRYRAITEGRIMSKGIPEYTGTWDLVIPAKGLFEIYVDRVDKKGTIYGHIEDTLGTANFVGLFTENNVEFYKKYNLTKSSSKAGEEFMMYKADGANGLYAGTFKIASGHSNGKEKPFSMRKFSDSAKLNLP